MRRIAIGLAAATFALDALGPRVDALAAQPSRRSGSDSVPRALAEALIVPSVGLVTMMMVSGGEPRLVVGTVPSNLTDGLWMPPGADVLGGLESSGAGVVVIHSTLPRDSLLAAYRREQLARNWLPAPPNTPPSMGFAPAPATADDPDRGLAYCRRGTYLVIGILDVDGIRRISAQASDIGREICNPANSARRAERYPSWWENRPTLVNPPGTGDGRPRDCVRFNSSGGGGSAYLSTSMSLDSLLAHYGRQLADSGWAGAPGVQHVSRSWTKRDSTGAFNELTLTARRRSEAPGCVEVEMGLAGRNP